MNTAVPPQQPYSSDQNSWTRRKVSARLKETPCVSGSDRLERLTHILHQRFSAPGLCLAKKTFDLREGLFYGAMGRKVRRGVWRQIKELAACAPKKLSDPLALV